eukprot:2111562-Pleurochrysis_carterae.AAC.1
MPPRAPPSRGPPRRARVPPRCDLLPHVCTSPWRTRLASRASMPRMPTSYISLPALRRRTGRR